MVFLRRSIRGCSISEPLFDARDVELEELEAVVALGEGWTVSPVAARAFASASLVCKTDRSASWRAAFKALTRVVERVAGVMRFMNIIKLNYLNKLTVIVREFERLLMRSNVTDLEMEISPHNDNSSRNKMLFL